MGSGEASCLPRLRPCKALEPSPPAPFPVRDGEPRGDRDVQRQLADAGVGTLIHYPIPPHMQAAYSALGIAPDDLPLASQLANEVLSLPIGPQTSSGEAMHVANVVRTAST